MLDLFMQLAPSLALPAASAIVPGLISRFIPQAAVAKIVLIAGLALGCIWLGWKVAWAFADQEKLAAVQAAHAQVQLRFITVTKVEKVVQEKIRNVYIKGKEIVREVQKVVTVEVERACPTGLPVGFVRVHDAAARNEVAGGATELDANPAGVTLAQAGEVIGDNYTEYHACREQVKGWNLFYGCLRDSTSENEVERCVQKEGPPEGGPASPGENRSPGPTSLAFSPSPVEGSTFDGFLLGQHHAVQALPANFQDQVFPPGPGD